MSSMKLPPKAQVIEALKADALTALQAAERAQAIATDEATGDESKSEGKYDTRATEASYLARGQAERVVELRRLVAWYERLDASKQVAQAALGALVLVEGEEAQVLFIAPVGGAAVRVDEVKVKSVSFSAPLGQAIRGLEEGDTFTLTLKGDARVLELVSLR